MYVLYVYQDALTTINKTDYINATKTDSVGNEDFIYEKVVAKKRDFDFFYLISIMNFEVKNQNIKNTNLQKLRK